MKCKKYLLIIKLYLVISLEPSFAAGQSMKKVIVHEYGQCSNRDPKNLAVVINNAFLFYRTQNLNINGNLTIKEDLPKDFYVSLFYVFTKYSPSFIVDSTF